MPETPQFRQVLVHLSNGDFTALDPILAEGLIQKWVNEGLFKEEREALNEALSCACFNGRLDVVRFLMDKGVDPTRGKKTGLDAIHCAASRGQLQTVQFLIERKVPLETVNAYGGTTLRCAIWCALNEPKSSHAAVIEALVRGGASLEGAANPPGDERIDAILDRWREAQTYGT